MRLDAPGAQPLVVADGIEAPGGLLLGEDGKLDHRRLRRRLPRGRARQPDRPRRACSASTSPRARRRRSRPAPRCPTASRATRPASIYASNDVGTGIDRVVGGKVQRNWARVVSGNGLAVERQRPLPVRQPDLPAGGDPAHRPHRPGDGRAVRRARRRRDLAAGLDGLTIDQDDRLFAAANQSGEVWRIDTDGVDLRARPRARTDRARSRFGGGGAFPATQPLRRHLRRRRRRDPGRRARRRRRGPRPAARGCACASARASCARAAARG